MFVFFKMLYNHSSTTYYIVNFNKDIYKSNNEKLETIFNTYYEIKDIHKPLYAISHYKVDDIEEILQKINITFHEKRKKKDNYDYIKKYFSDILI